MKLFTKKSLAQLDAESERNPLRRSLGRVQLIALGVGSIIGTGIFVMTGTAASQNAGPALVLSMILTTVGCAFSGLCYAEFAAMVPIAGSAYTYAYATIGEFVAWIIGWDLILEYALSVSTVAVGWSGYFVSFANDIGIHIPVALTTPLGKVVTDQSGATVTGIVNLPAIFIVLVVSTLLISGIRQSANANTVMVFIKSMVLVVFVVAGAAYVKRANLTPFIPPNTGSFGHFGWSGVLRGAGVMFFAYIGFDAVTTAAQESKDPQRDMPVGILGSLAICTVHLHRRRDRAHRDRALFEAQRRGSARRGNRRDGAHVAEPRDQGERALRPVQHDARTAARANANLLFNVAGRAASSRVRARALAVQNAAREHDAHGHRVRARIAGSRRSRCSASS